MQGLIPQTKQVKIYVRYGKSKFSQTPRQNLAQLPHCKTLSRPTQQ